MTADITGNHGQTENGYVKLIAVFVFDDQEFSFDATGMQRFQTPVSSDAVFFVYYRIAIFQFCQGTYY